MTTRNIACIRRNFLFIEILLKSSGEEGEILKVKDHGHPRWQPAWSLLIVSLLLLGLMIWNVTMVQSKILHRAEKNYQQEQTIKISAGIEGVNQASEKLALKVVSNAKLMEAFKERDKAQMNKILQPTFNQWKQSNGVTELSLTNQEGQAIWSSAADINFADDMSYQRIIGKSLRQKNVISALDSSENKDLLVTTMPIFIDGEYAGLCKVGVSMSWLGSKLQKSGPSQFAIFQLNGIESTLLWSNKKVQPSLNTADIKKLHDGKTISGSLNRSTGLLVVPLQDIDGITVAYVQNTFSLREFLAAKVMNYSLLLLAFLFVVLANYVCGRGRFDHNEDMGASIARIEKVAFSIDANKPQKNSQQEE